MLCLLRSKTKYALEIGFQPGFGAIQGWFAANGGRRKFSERAALALARAIAGELGTPDLVLERVARPREENAAS